MKQLLSLASRLRQWHLLVCLMFLLGLPLTASAIDTVYINSQQDWKDFCSKYDNTVVNVFLNTDVKINTKGYQMNKFIGTLDGQGHAFIINYKDDKSEAQNKPYYDKNWTKDSAPFEYASGTIKNLRITGTVAIRHGSFAYRQNNPLTEKIDNYYNSGLTIENCHCDVAFVVTDTKKTAGRTNAFVGGFVGKVDVGCEVTFDNCSFTGSFTYTNPNPDNGFVQERVSGFVGTCKWGGFAISGKVTLNNCFSYITYDDRVAIRDFSYFVGGVKGETSVTNSYGYCVNKKGEPKTLTNDEGCTDLTTASGGAQMISSGELTWKLNGSRGTGKTWAQTIGSDSVPRLCTYFPTSLEVFNKESTRHYTKQDGWSSIYSPLDVSLPAGVTPYVVTGINETDHTVTVSPYSGSPARVPLLLHTDGEAQTITVPAGYYNKYNAVGYLRGAYDDLAASDQYRVVDANGNFGKPTATIPAWSCYLLGATADSYTLDTSGGDYGKIVLLYSTDDWNDFCKNYSGTRVTAYLGADITVTNNDEQCSSFIGTFDGQGHCLTLPTEKALCNYAEGTVKNLKVYSDCKGVFAKRNSSDGDIHFADIFSDSPLIYDAKGTLTYSNVLYLFPESSGQSKMAIYSESEWEEGLTDEQLANGEVTYKLNAGRTGSDAVWTQTIGEDNMPQLMSTTSKEVFYAAASKREATSDNWSTLYYPANLDLSSNADLHIYDDFRLTGDSLYCNENLTGQLTASMPALLYSPSGLPAITLPEAYYNKVEPTTELIGVYADTDASTLNTLTTETAEDGTETVLFATPAAGSTTLLAWQCYTTSAAKVVDDGAVITSKDDWNKFKSHYSGRSINARLATDLMLTDDDAPMTSFKGTFDGQGHTITVDYSRGTENSIHAPFQQAAGTIKNLQLTGTISIKNNSTAARIYAAPLVSGLKGSATETVTLNIENCHSSVTFQEDEVGKGLLDAGGFVRETSAYTTLNFTDCSFTGAFNTPGQLSGVGCFVGNTSNYNSIGFTFTNCFSDASGSTFGSIATADGASYLVRSLKSNNSLTVTNCSAVKVGDFNAHTTRCTLNLVDSATAASGSQAYALNAGRTSSDAVWMQTIGTDTVPQLALFSADSKEVYRASDTVTIPTTGWATHYYPVAIEKPEGMTVYTITGVKASEKSEKSDSSENSDSSESSDSSDYIVQLTEIEDSIPANTPVLLCTLADDEKTAAEAKTIEMPVYYYNTLADEDIEDNGQDYYLIGVSRDTEAFDGTYVLQTATDEQGNTVTAFRLVGQTEEAERPTVPAWQCLLFYVSESEETATWPSIIYLSEKDTPTAINTARAADALNSLLGTGKVYDLSGRQIKNGQLQKGQVYIKNGQKFTVK